jgi:hypothetical protein
MTSEQIEALTQFFVESLVDADLKTKALLRAFEVAVRECRNEPAAILRSARMEASTLNQ